MNDFVFVCIEDDKIFLNKIKDILQSFFARQGYKIIVYSYEELYLDRIPKNVDAFFLDIEVKNGNTIDLMQKIRNKGDVTPIIVISNYDSYIFDSVHYQVFDFIRKKRFSDDIEISLRKLFNYLTINNEILIFTYEKQLYKIKIKDIIFVNIYSHHIVINCINNRRIDIWKDYKEIFLKNYPLLVRIHKSYVINLMYCDKIVNRKAIMKNKVEIPISRTKYSEVKKQYLKKL